MIDLKCSLNVRESGAGSGFIYGSTMSVDDIAEVRCDSL